mgnify:CR=1 FL=1
MNTIPLIETDEGEVLVRGVPTPKRTTRTSWTTWATMLLAYVLLFALTMLAILGVFTPFSSIAVLVLTPAFIFGFSRDHIEALIWYELDFKTGTIKEVRG